MNWTEKQIRYIIQEMADENTLACKALFSISDIRFTKEVSTMSVSLGGHPELLINMDFCNEHLQVENDVKAVLMHEFLHVMLLHTEKYETSNPALNFALDAIINAIIYRYMGMEYAGLFARLYPWKPLLCLLRPAADQGFEGDKSSWYDIHNAIYSGKYCADDLYELLTYLESRVAFKAFEDFLLLGDHTPGRISPEGGIILNGILKKMNGTLIWNRSRLSGLGNSEDQEAIKIKSRNLQKWKKSTAAILRKCFMPDRSDKSQTSIKEIVLPVISNSDRRSMARFIHSGLIPFSINHVIQNEVSEKVTVYLDVSGSMNQEIDAIVSLLYHFRAYVKTPLYVFSNDVYEARFKDQKLIFNTTYGTSIEPVLRHIRVKKLRKCLIVTDGYVEPISPFVLEGINRENIWILISNSGNPAEFEKNGFPYHQLKRL